MPQRSRKCSDKRLRRDIQFFMICSELSFDLGGFFIRLVVWRFLAVAELWWLAMVGVGNEPTVNSNCKGSLEIVEVWKRSKGYMWILPETKWLTFLMKRGHQFSEGYFRCLHCAFAPFHLKRKFLAIWAWSMAFNYLWSSLFQRVWAKILFRFVSFLPTLFPPFMLSDHWLLLKFQTICSWGFTHLFSWSSFKQHDFAVDLELPFPMHWLLSDSFSGIKLC